VAKTWRRGRAAGLIADSVPTDREFRQRAFVACAWAISVVAALNLLAGQYPVAAVRGTWALLGTAVTLLRPRNALRSTLQMWLMLPLTLVGSAAVTLVLPMEEALPNLASFAVQPVLVALISRGDVSLSTAAALGSAAVVFALGRSWGLTAHELGAWGAVMGAYGFVAWACSRFIHRANTRERAVQSERLQLARALAQSERRRIETERMATIGRLSSGVAHEVNNPLAFALANVAFAQEALASGGSPELLSALADAETGMKRIQAIVTDLRTFARGPAPDARQAEARKGIDAAMQLAGVRMKMLQFTLNAPATLGVVRLDELRLSQVLLNLLLNAVDAVEEQRAPEGPRVSLTARREGDAVCIDVEDNGCGIAPQALQRLFEPFTTTKPPGKGTGLGLAVAREFVLGAGGTLVGKNLARGACFSVRLPVLELLHLAPEEPAASGAGRSEQ
jgi:C4-dicarboxylate-specific signal transduction histidine kinase